MEKKNIFLIIISVLLFILAVGVVITGFYDTGIDDVQREKETQKVIEKVKNNSIQKPTTENIDVNEIEDKLIEINQEAKEVIGEDEGVTSAEEELVYVGQNQANREKDAINKDYTDFVVETIDGKEISLSSYSGKPMVLLFWRSDVGETLKVLNDLDLAYDRYGDKIDFVCIDVCIDEPSSKEDVQKYLESNNIDIAMYYDTNNNAIESYNISFLPSVIYLDKNRNIINTKEGLLTYDSLEGIIDLLLGNY